MGRESASTSHNITRLFVHIVWATWDRLPLLTPSIERLVLRCIEANAEGLGCRVVALNGMPDHVHLLLLMPPTLAVSDLMKQVKGSSSHLANHSKESVALFRWQGSYGAFSVSRGDVDKVTEYVTTQKTRHQLGRLYLELECAENPVDTLVSHGPGTPLQSGEPILT